MVAGAPRAFNRLRLGSRRKNDQARTLDWADEAASRHDYVEAVRWVKTVRRLGPELPDGYETKYETWLSALDFDRNSGSD